MQPGIALFVGDQEPYRPECRIHESILLLGVSSWTVSSNRLKGVSYDSNDLLRHCALKLGVRFRPKRHERPKSDSLSADILVDSRRRQVS